MGQKKAVKAAQVQSEKVYRGKVYTRESYDTVNYDGESYNEEHYTGESEMTMYGLVPFQGTPGDNMEHIVDITEEFSQTMDPILRMYSAAMSATTARLEIIEDEFRYRKQRCPIHHIGQRCVCLLYTYTSPRDTT